jgi:MFS family permease
MAPLAGRQRGRRFGGRNGMGEQGGQQATAQATPEHVAAGWPAVVVIYLYTVLSMATVGMVASLTQDFATALAAPQKRIGLAIAMFSAPSALLAAAGGAIIDRLGARPAMLVCAGVSLVADAAAFSAHSTLALNLALLLAGLGFAGISVAAPAMIVTTLKGPLQVRAMSLWSTYAPTGFALGLLLAAPFAGTGRWGMAIGLHGFLMALALAAGALLLPARPISRRASASLHQRLKDLAGAVADRRVLRLALAVALPSAISYGASLLAPSYLARVHHLGIGASSIAVALAKAGAMIICGLVMGQLLAHRINRKALYALFCAVGLVAQLAVFYPGDTFVLAAAGLVAWLIAYGGMAAIGMATLPLVIRDPAHSGAASGLIGQGVSVASFLTPAVYFGMPHWPGFILAACIGLAVSLLALPGRTPPT